LERNKSGVITFEELLQGLPVISKSFYTYDEIQGIYQYFLRNDSSSKGINLVQFLNEFSSLQEATNFTTKLDFVG
jgi:hypothetical protein